MDILGWIKANAKEGANVAEAEELLNQANPISGLENADQALSFMLGNDKLKSGLDSYTRKAIESHDDKFRESKLPDMLKAERDKIISEMNPKETEEQKQLREMRDEMAQMKNREKQQAIQAELRSKAKELGYPTDRAERFAIHGDDAIGELEAAAQWFNESVNAKVDETVKAKYSGQTPKSSTKPVGDNVMQREGYMNLTPQAQSDFVSNGGIVTD